MYLIICCVMFEFLSCISGMCVGSVFGCVWLSVSSVLIFVLRLKIVCRLLCGVNNLCGGCYMSV